MTEDDAAEVAPAYDAESLHRMGAKWLDLIRQAEKREERWRKDAEAAQAAFLADDSDSGHGKVYEFNILHSNVETIAAAVYNNTPQPDIRERFKTGRQMDPVANKAAQVIERIIIVMTDDSRLDAEMEASSTDALVAGRGIVRVRFEAEEALSEPMPIVDGMGQPAIDPETGEPMMTEPEPIVTNERIAFEVVSWRDYREGPALRWQDVPWVAFRHTIPGEEVDRIRDPEIKKVLDAAGNPENRSSEDSADSEVWEIWCKATSRVYMVTAGAGDVLSIMDDPLGLTGFFPMPDPVRPITMASRRTPVSPFAVYRQLAEELDQTTRRIRKITQGLKVRGLLAGAAEDIERLADADDNTLTAVSNLEGLAAIGGIDRAITWWPVDQAIKVLQQLYASREATKQMIYEITGISDIVRGATAASETATAQQIKSQWGGLRIRKLQKMMERQVRDLFVISAELVSKFSVETMQRIANMQIEPEVAELLRAPLDHYRIDVESNTTVAEGAMRRRGEVTEFLNGTAAFFQTVQPITQMNPALADPFGKIYAAFARDLDMGSAAKDAIEDIAEAMSQAAQQAQQMMQAQQQQAQQEQAMQMEMAQREAAREDAKVQIEAQEAGFEGARVQLEAQQMQQRAMMGV